MGQILLGLFFILVSCVLVKLEDNPTMGYKRVVVALFFIGIIVTITGIIF